MKQYRPLAKLAHTVFLTGSAVMMGVAAVYLFVPLGAEIDGIKTGTVVDSTLRGTETDTAIAPALPDPALAQLKDGLKALANGDIAALRVSRDTFKDTQIEYRVLTWLMATSGKRAVTSGEIKAAQKLLADWPSQSTMAKNLERAMVRGGLAGVQLRFALGEQPPETFEATFAVARTYLLTGQNDKARVLLLPFWHKGILSANDEKLTLATFGDVLTKQDHEIRYFTMMSRERITSATRLVSALENQQIHAAWTAVIRRNKNAAALMTGLSDDDRKTLDYAFMRTEFLRRSDKDDDAIKILSALPVNADALINPDAWWDERRIIARHKYEEGDAKAAYALVAAQAGGSTKTRIDAAFHAGWFALRGLDNPQKAVSHFLKIAQLAQGNLSKARGYYWLGRALTDDVASRTAFEKAAQFSTTFYGQLASAALKKPLARSGLPVPADKPIEPLAAIDRLTEAGDITAARKLYIALGWQEDDPAILRAVADHAAQNADYYAALKVAKAAAWRGIDVGALTHPVGAISDGTALSPGDHALAYAVARQESEFNIGAVSRANARGILQVLPGTARAMAKQQNIAYTPGKLTSDANYNARLGTAYLNQQLDRFDGSYILTFAAYNAGPSRAKDWVERFGDPRGTKLEEVIDWIEMIPFPETRNYVQRILENYQVYKLQLGQDTSLVSDLRFGRTK